MKKEIQKLDKIDRIRDQFDKNFEKNRPKAYQAMILMQQQVRLYQEKLEELRQHIKSLEWL